MQRISICLFLIVILSGCSAINNSSVAVPAPYTACGCGCCGGETPEKKCLYHSKGDDINKIIQDDSEAKASKQCSLMGCGKGVEYVYCDSEKNTSNPQPSSDSCTADSDCAIKDVHNCCGYYPGCVNKDFQPDIDTVVKRCKEKNGADICGFPKINGCKCANNRCKSY
jgi:hypothetical protein